MEKCEAQMIAPEKSRELLDYIEQFMSYEGVSGSIVIDSDKDPETNELMCNIKIRIYGGFERDLKTEITAQQSDVLSEQILVDIAEKYARDNEVVVSRFFTVRSMDHSMYGINIMNHKGSRISLDFQCRGLEFDKVVASYSRTLTREQNKIHMIRSI